MANECLLRCKFVLVKGKVGGCSILFNLQMQRRDGILFQNWVKIIPMLFINLPKVEIILMILLTRCQKLKLV